MNIDKTSVEQFRPSNFRIAICNKSNGKLVGFAPPGPIHFLSRCESSMVTFQGCLKVKITDYIILKILKVTMSAFYFHN